MVHNSFTKESSLRLGSALVLNDFLRVFNVKQIFQHLLGGKELWQMFYNSLVTPQTRCTTSQKSLSTQKKTLFNANLHLSLSLACKWVHMSDETNSSRKNSIWILPVRDLCKGVQKFNPPFCAVYQQPTTQQY